MENPFKNIISHEKLPDKIKDRVMSDVESIKLMLEIADLTLVEYPSVVNSIFKQSKIKF